MAEEEFDHTKHEIWRKDIRAFCVSAKDHWKELAGGGAVSAVIGWTSSAAFGLPSTAASIVGLAMFIAIACFLAFRDQRRKAETAEEKAETAEEKAETAEEKFRQLQIETGKLSEVREKLGALLQDGSVLMVLLKTELELSNSVATGLVSRGGAIAQCIKWDKEATAFIGASFGSSYVTRFRSEIGIAIPDNIKQLAEICPEVQSLHIRLFRLHQFLETESTWPAIAIHSTVTA